MLIVIEGPEGAGKSTWCKKFAEVWPHTTVLVHHTKGSSTPEQVTMELRAFSRFPNHWAILFDRWFYSEYVYATLSGRSNDMGIGLDEAEATFGAAIDFRMLLLPTLSTLVSRASEDDYGIDKGAERTLYASLLQDWPRDVAVEPVVERLLELVQKEAEALAAVETAKAAKAEGMASLRAMGKAQEEDIAEQPGETGSL